MRVQDVMTERVRTIGPAAAAEEAWNLMRFHGIHHLVVTEATQVVGVLSDRDAGSRRCGAIRMTGRPTLHHRAPHRKSKGVVAAW